MPGRGRTMSGGSYEYLYRDDSLDMLGARLAVMVRRVEGSHPGTPGTLRLRALLEQVRAATDAFAAAADVMHAVEWTDSCDWSEDQLTAALDPPTPIPPPPDPVRLAALARAYIDLWQLAYHQGPVALSCEGKGDKEAVRLRGESEPITKGAYDAPEFLDALRATAARKSQSR